ncbi:hypothetical protein AB4Z35_30145, partial [Pseudomonas sp. KB_15]|uniref:hypothetical protein n=1 Tax=Pseudomonas sp. KB_15 TaxID=3233035 RepID=UPI003F9CB59A
LSMLHDGEIAALYARHTSEFTPHGLSLAKTDSLVNEGVSGVGMRFEITPGNFAAVSVAAIRSRMQESRKQWIADLIAEELRSAGFRCAYAGTGLDGAPGADLA